MHALHKLQHDTVWPNCRPNPQIDAIELQYVYTLFNWKPHHRHFGVDCCTHGNYDIAVEKLRRTWNFSFCLSFYENTMGYQHKLNNQHIHFHSLVHILAGLNENQRLPVLFQKLLHIIWYWRPSHAVKFPANPQSPNKMIRLPTPNPQKKHAERSISVMVAKYHKLYRYSKRDFSSNKATSTLRTVFAEKSDSWFLRRYRRFMTIVRSNSIKQPCRRPMRVSNRLISPSNVGNLPFTRLRRYFSLRL